MNLVPPAAPGAQADYGVVWQTAQIHGPTAGNHLLLLPQVAAWEGPADQVARKAHTGKGRCVRDGRSGSPRRLPSREAREADSVHPGDRTVYKYRKPSKSRLEAAKQPSRYPFTLPESKTSRTAAAMQARPQNEGMFADALDHWALQPEPWGLR